MLSRSAAPPRTPPWRRRRNSDAQKHERMVTIVRTLRGFVICCYSTFYSNREMVPRSFPHSDRRDKGRRRGPLRSRKPRRASSVAVAASQWGPEMGGTARRCVDVQQNGCYVRGRRCVSPTSLLQYHYYTDCTVGSRNPRHRHMADRRGQQASRSPSAVMSSCCCTVSVPRIAIYPARDIVSLRVYHHFCRI